MSRHDYNKTREKFECAGNPFQQKQSSCDVIELPALGRPFRLGMLYDRRKNMVIPGETLWSTDVLMEHTTLDNQEGCCFHISAEDSIGEKTSIFEIDGQFKLNFMSGLKSVGGSGKFLYDNKSSENKVRVSLICSFVTHYRQITLPLKIEMSETLTNTDATHIIAAIKYGANMIFMFERTVSEQEDKLTVKGELHGKVAKIPTTQFEGSIEMQYKVTEKKRDDKISCRYFGDVILPSNPTTYDEAMEMYKNLPSHINKDKSAPVVVWLYPLSKLKHKERETVYTGMISYQNVETFEDIFENLNDISIKCNDIMHTRACILIPQIKHQIMKFSRHIKLYRQVVKDKLTTALTDDTNMHLAQIKKDHNDSPFSSSQLNENIKTMSSETNLLGICIEELSQHDIQFVSEDFDLTVKKFSNEKVIVLRVLLPLYYERISREMESYLESLYPESKIKVRQDEDAIKTKSGNQIWYNDDQILQRLRKCIKHFVQFSTMNKDGDIVCTAMILFQDNVDSSKYTKFEYYSEMELKKESYETMTSDEISSFIEE